MSRTEEGRRRNVEATVARHKGRYATDPVYRARIIAEAKAWYYANRERVLERMRVKRAAESVGMVAIDLTADVERVLERRRAKRKGVG